MREFCNARKTFTVDFKYEEIFDFLYGFFLTESRRRKQDRKVRENLDNRDWQTVSKF